MRGGKSANRRAVDALRMPLYSWRHPRGSHVQRDQLDLGNPSYYLTKAGVRRLQIQSSSIVGSSVSSGMKDLTQRLTTTQRQNIMKLLEGASTDVARVLELPQDLVRSNLFEKSDNDRVCIIRALTFNMNREEELTISLPVGIGSTGRCFETGQPNIAIFSEDWGKDNMEEPEFRKMHPDLRWVISVPVSATERDLRPKWVLNVDGLQTRKEDYELRGALGQIFGWSQMVSLVIGKSES